MAAPKNPIVLRQGQTVGAPAAEDDGAFLFDTFVEHQAYHTLVDMDDPRFLLVGRTGTGKTAVLRVLERNRNNVIRIDPMELSLQYISNSDIIKYFYDRGVKLDLFFQLLWRHVIATELIKRHFKLDDGTATKKFFSGLQNIVSEKRRRAIEYMQSFGSDFWLETDSRVTQVTQKFEGELASSAGIDISGIKGNASAKVNASEEVSKEFTARAQRVVDSIHIQQLSDVIEWLADSVFTDERNPCYVVIDDLDLNFAGGEIKDWLIRALIETCKKYRRISNVKIILAMRTDLVARVFDKTRDEGFQEEKYQGNTVRLTWTPDQLKSLIDKRIVASIRRRYSGSNINFHALFPNRLSGQDSFDYIVERTLHRPRDLIAFVNECLERSISKDRVTVKAIRQAEIPYSAGRFNALRDEWRSQHPLLEKYCNAIPSGVRRFEIAHLPADAMSDLALSLTMSKDAALDTLAAEANAFIERQISRDAFLREWLNDLYKIGIVGVKPGPTRPPLWSYEGQQSLTNPDIGAESSAYVHPMLYARFGIVARREGVDSAEDD